MYNYNVCISQCRRKHGVVCEHNGKGDHQREAEERGVRHQDIKRFPESFQDRDESMNANHSFTHSHVYTYTCMMYNTHAHVQEMSLRLAVGSLKKATQCVKCGYPCAR